MSFHIITADFDGGSTAGGGSGGSGGVLAQVMTLWQVTGCDGTPIGTPVKALQVVAINKMQSSICNPESIVGTYDLVKRVVLEGASITVNQKTVHSLTYKVISGSGTITLPGGTTNIYTGEAGSYTASKLIGHDITIAANEGAIVAVETISTNPTP